MGSWKFHFDLNLNEVDRLRRWDWSAWFGWAKLSFWQSWVTWESLLDSLRHPGRHLSVWLNDQNQVGAFVFWVTLLPDIEIWLMAKDERLIPFSFSYFWYQWENSIRESFQGPVALWVEVSADNMPALKFYHKVGFQLYGVRSRYYQSGQDAQLWVKKLGPAEEA